MKTKIRPNCSGFVMNVSPAGVFLVTQELLSAGTEVLLYLSFETGPRKKTQLCFLTGRVVRIDARYRGSLLRGYGIEFVPGNSPSSLKMVRDYVAEHPPA